MKFKKHTIVAAGVLLVMLLSMTSFAGDFSFGDRNFNIPEPAGLVELEASRAALVEKFKKSRLIAAYVTESDRYLLLSGKNMRLEKYAFCVSSESLETSGFTQEMLKSYAPKMAKELESDADTVRFLISKPNAYEYLLIATIPNSGFWTNAKLITVMCIMRVKNRLLIMMVNQKYENPGSTAETAKRADDWVNAILAANK